MSIRFRPLCGLALLGLLVLLLGTGCGDKRKSPTNPTAVGGGPVAAVVLTANPNSIAPGGSATVTAVAQSAGGLPIPGRAAHLSTTLGTLSQTTGTTDGAGAFAATLQTRPEDTGKATVTATSEGVSATVDIALVVGGFTISPTSAALAPGGTQTFTVGGGVAPYTWSAGGGTVSSTSGTTTTYTAGTASGTFAVTVRDSAGTTASAAITITVQALTISPTSATMAPGAKQTFAVGGGTAPYTWSAGGGTVTPTSGSTTTYTAGNTPGSFSVTVRDSAGATASAAITIAVQTLTVSPSSVALPIGTSQTFTAGGGVVPYTWSAGGGTISSTSEPATTYTAGNTPGVFAVAVRDSAGASASATVTITATTLTISPTSATVPAGATQTFAAGGATAPYTWSAGGGTITPTSGTTTTYTAGTAPGIFAVTVRDSAGAAASATVTVPSTTPP